MKLFLRLIRYIFPYKGNIILILISNFLYAIFSIFSLTLVVPFLSVLFKQVEKVTLKPELHFSVRSVIDLFYYYMNQLIDKSGPVSALLMIAFTMVILSFLSNLFRYLGQFWLAPIRTGVLNNLRKDLYHKIIILPLSFFAQQKKGDLMNRMGSDVQEVEWSIISSLQSFCRDPFLLIIFLGTLFKVNYKLTIISLILIPLSGFLISVVGKSIQRNSTKSQKLLGQLSVMFDETIGGLRVIKGYNAIDHAYKKFSEESSKHYRVNKKIFIISELGSPMVEFLSIFTMMIVLFIGGKFILNDSHFSAQIFVMYIVVFARIIPPAKQLITVFYTIKKGMPSMQRIFGIMDAEEVIVEKVNPLSIKLFHDSIRYNNVSFSYDSQKAEVDCDILKNISLTLHKGEKIAFVGASGSGKSTLVDLLPRFYDIKYGNIFIDDFDIKEYAISDLRNLFGIVSQDVILVNDTVLNNIAFGQHSVSRDQVIAAAKIAQADEFILQLENGYDTVIGERGMTLSGGQRQRLSIARAVLKNPQILIFDEATSALDNESEYLVQSALDSMMDEKTAIIIAHRLSTIKNVDRIFLIDKGEIVEQGSHDELMSLKGEYYRFYMIQQIEK